MTAFRGIHVLPAKHSFGKCDRKVWQTDRRMDGQTDRRRTKWSLCVAMLGRRQKCILPYISTAHGTKWFTWSSLCWWHIHGNRFVVRRQGFQGHMCIQRHIGPQIQANIIYMWCGQKIGCGRHGKGGNCWIYQENIHQTVKEMWKWSKVSHGDIKNRQGNWPCMIFKGR